MDIKQFIPQDSASSNHKEKRTVHSVPNDSGKYGQTSNSGKQTRAVNTANTIVVTGKVDFPLFAAILAITLFGLVMVFSASYYSALDSGESIFSVVFKQMKMFMIGMAGMLFFAFFFDYMKLKKLATIGYLLGIAILVLVLLFGSEVNGSKRWLDLGVSFQPSEPAKLALVLFMAKFMTDKQHNMHTFWKGMVPMLIVIGIYSGLILLQPNMSMAVIVAVTGIAFMFIGGANIWYVSSLLPIGVAGCYVLGMAESYRMERMLSFTNPWADPLDTGYQLIQSLYALGAGGLVGTGIGASRQKLLFLTYADSDYIFAIIGEEIGFIGAALLLTAYAYVIMRGMYIAAKCRTRFGSLLASGISIVLFLQVIINVAVACGAAPSTGQPLPFISSGGTSLVFSLIAAGVLLNISKDLRWSGESIAGKKA